jgi:hypothetical protein
MFLLNDAVVGMVGWRSEVPKHGELDEETRAALGLNHQGQEEEEEEEEEENERGEGLRYR